METAVAKAKQSMPTGAEVLEGGKELGGIVLGLVGAKALVTAIKKDTVIVNSGLTALGFGGALLATKHKKPFFAMVGYGVAVFGAMRLANSAVKEVASPETTEGLNGLLPESAKSLIRKYLPTLGSTEDMQGAEYMSGSDDMQGVENLALDDFQGTDDMQGAEEMQGLSEGSSSLLA